MGDRRTSEQKELPTGMGMSVGGSDKAACPENTSASWIAKVRRSKMRHKSETYSEAMQEFENHGEESILNAMASA